jgi:hypothetical protein
LAGSCAVLDEEAAPLSLDEELAAGALGVLEPLAALELGALLLGAVVLAEPLALVEPPDAESFFVASADEEELEDAGGALGFTFTDAEPEVEPAGADGVVVEPAEEDEEPAGGVVLVMVRSPSLSQPVRIPAPSARDTATAKVVSLIMGLRGLG